MTSADIAPPEISSNIISKINSSAECACAIIGPYDGRLYTCMTCGKTSSKSLVMLSPADNNASSSSHDVPDAEWNRFLEHWFMKSDAFKDAMRAARLKVVRMNREDTKKRLIKLISEVDPHELACRVLEGAMGITRPKGTTAIQALETVDSEARAQLYKAGQNVLEYIAECINAGKIPS